VYVIEEIVLQNLKLMLLQKLCKFQLLTTEWQQRRILIMHKKKDTDR